MSKPLNVYWEQVVSGNEQEDCWIFAGRIQYKGYGIVVKWFEGKNYTYTVHRLVYEKFKGEIPEKYEIDHLCRVRRCINPDHLQAVTHEINMSRSPHFGIGSVGFCRRGHKFTPENTYIAKYKDKPNKKQCRICTNERHRAAYYKKKVSTRS